MTEKTDLLPLRAPRTFTSRNDYRQQLKNYQGRAVQAAREESGGKLNAAEARAIRDRVFAKFITAHGSIDAVPALDPNAQGEARAKHTAQPPMPDEEAPLFTRGVPRRVPTPRAPKAPALAQEPQAQAPVLNQYDAPAGARVVVQCAANSCSSWVAARPGKPTLRRCPAHAPRPRLGLAPELDLAEELAEATA